MAEFQPRSREAAAQRARRLAEIDARSDVELVGRLSDGTTVEVERLGPIALSGDRDPWERQPGESDKAWHAFTIFRDTPPGRRTLVVVHDELYDSVIGEDVPHSNPRLDDWCAQYRWRERVEAYDIYQDTLARQYLEGMRIQSRVRYADLGAEMQQKAAEALALYKAIAHVRVKDRKTGEVKTVPRANMSVGELVKLAEVGVKLQRLALGEMDGKGTQLAIGVQLNIGDDRLVEEARAVIEARQENALTLDQL